jgi:hypothetical protein
MKLASTDLVLDYDREELDSTESHVIIMRCKANNKYLGTAAVYFVDKITGELFTLMKTEDRLHDFDLRSKSIAPAQEAKKS